MKYRGLMVIFSLITILITGNVYATTVINSFENGEVVDSAIGQGNNPDGIGDEAILNTSSITNIVTAGGPFDPVTRDSQQAMAYFHLPTLNIGSALFEWDVRQAQGGGAPDSVNVYGMLNDSSLSTDDFNKGVLLGNLNTTGFSSGDIISLDITTFLQGFSGDFGIRLETTSPFGNSSQGRFLAFSNNNARVTVVPVPTAVWLFGTGLLGLIGIKRKSTKATVISA